MHWVATEGGRRRQSPAKCGLFWRSAFVGLVTLLAAISRAEPTEAYRLSIQRTVVFTSPSWNGDDEGRLVIDATLERNGAHLAGTAEIHLDWTWDHPPCPDPVGFRGVTGSGHVVGNIEEGRLHLDVVVPVEGKYLSLKAQILGMAFCIEELVRFDYGIEGMIWGKFDLALNEGRHYSVVESRSHEGGTIELLGQVSTTVSPAPPGEWGSEFADLQNGVQSGSERDFSASAGPLLPPKQNRSGMATLPFLGRLEEQP